MLFSSTVLGSLVLNALAQSDTECPIYKPCREVNDQYRITTCDPMLSGANANATMYAMCICYNSVNTELCYDQCLRDASVQAERIVYRQKVSQDCTAAGLNPKALPRPAPWDKFTPAATIPKTIAPVTTSATATPKATATNPVKSGAEKVVATLSGLIALLFAL